MGNLFDVVHETLSSFGLILAFLGLAVGLTVLRIVFFIASGGQKAALRARLEYAKRRGYSLVNPGIAEMLLLKPFPFARAVNSPLLKSCTEGLGDIDEFGEKSRTSGVDGLIIDLHGRRATVFAHTYSSGATRDRHLRRLKVLKAPSEGMPRFRLSRKSTGNKILGFVGARRPLSIASHPGFSAAFDLTVPNPVDDPAVKSFFDPARLDRLASIPFQGEIVVGSEHVVYLELGNFDTDESFDEFISRGKGALGALLPDARARIAR